MRAILRANGRDDDDLDAAYISDDSVESQLTESVNPETNVPFD